MEQAKGIIIPVWADYILIPEIFYGDKLTGIYFETHDDQFGRITFDNLDAIKICRGENLPFEDDDKVGQDVVWVYKIENSEWLKERFKYENENYGISYEFGGDVSEMLTDFSHYVFKFHDQFVEAIARGFWFEKDAASMFKRAFKDGHPFLPLLQVNTKSFQVNGIKCKAVFNPLDMEALVQHTKYCPQKLIEFVIEFEGEYSSICQTLIIMQRQNQLTSVLSPFMGRPEFAKSGIATFEEVKPFVDKYIREVAERRRQTRK